MTELNLSKPWRVQRVGSFYEDFRSKAAAYRSAIELSALGFEIKVWHFASEAGGGTWRLYEHIEPPRQAQREMEAG